MFCRGNAVRCSRVAGSHAWRCARSDAWRLSLQSGADLVHDVSGEVCIAEGDDAILDQTPTLVEVLAGADLLLQACG